MLPSQTKKLAYYGERGSLESMRNECIQVDYSDKKLQLQTTSVTAYSQAYIIQNDDRTSVFFTFPDV